MREFIVLAVVVISSLTVANAFLESRNDVTYRQAREHLYKISRRKGREGYYIKDVYCNKRVPFIKGIPSPSVMNTEHTWPQSKFSKNYPAIKQKNDLHHLYPVDSRANSSRSNHMFAEVLGGVANDNCYASKKGYALGTHQTAFEPPEEHKGNVARAMFYFSKKYNMRIGRVQEEYLREWHKSDPVDFTEERRNGLIEKFQGNRNQFIDDEGLVDLVEDF
tara:strand:+ start:5757 stop:6416 length:660 start_codon:yes stop_codon:yes gene_type:complete